MNMVAGIALGMFGALAWVILGGILMQSRGVLGGEFYQAMQLFLWAPLPVTVGFLGGWLAGELPEGAFWKPAYGWIMGLLVALALGAGLLLPR